MSASRALIYLVRRKHLLPCTTAVTSIRTNLYLPVYTPQATYAEQKTITKTEQSSSNKQVQVGLGEVVKENTKSAWYLVVIVTGVVTTAGLFYAIFRELFSGNSPNNIYSKTAERCINESRVIDALGEPIKAYGEETRRGRRGHVSHTIYEKDGVKRLRMKFYLQGLRKQGTVHLEMREDPNGNWVYRYLFIQMKDMARSVIILEDNREIENTVYTSPDDVAELVPPGYRL